MNTGFFFEMIKIVLRIYFDGCPTLNMFKTLNYTLYMGGVGYMNFTSQAI